MSDNFQSYDDEIDLFELFETLWSEKFLIANITFSCGVIGTFYAFMATPTYKAEVLLLPAKKAVMARYNPVEYGSLAGLGVQSLSADVEFTETLNQIRSVVAGAVSESVEISKKQNCSPNYRVISNLGCC